MQRILKQPDEVLFLDLPTFEGIAPPEVQMTSDVDFEARGLVPGGAQLGVNVIGAKIRVEGGASGEIYLLTVSANAASGQVGRKEIEVHCIDLSWSMPDGGAPWLTISQFVAKFGFEETVRMTDVRGDGRIDRDLLVNALVDAQAMAEAHVFGRVTIDAQAVPPIIQVIVADLARARLYPGEAPEGIDRQAKVAMRNLEKMQSGQMTLGMAVPAAPENDEPILFTKKPSAFPDRLKGSDEPNYPLRRQCCQSAARCGKAYERHAPHDGRDRHRNARPDPGAICS